MKKRYCYMKSEWDGGFPSLIRLSHFTPWEADFYAFPGKWVSMPSLNDIRVGKGCYMDYDDITDEEAMELKKEIQAEYDRMAAEKKEKAYDSDPEEKDT